MEKLTLAFLGLLILLLFTHIIRVEAFGDGSSSQPGKTTYRYIFDPLSFTYNPYDASGNYTGLGSSQYDASGNYTAAPGGYDAYGNFIGPSGPYDANGNFVGMADTLNEIYNSATNTVGKRANSIDGTINGLPAGTPGLPNTNPRTTPTSNVTYNVHYHVSGATDNSGAKVQSGSYINLSISDLLALIGNTSSKNKAPQPIPMNYGMNANAYATPAMYPMYNAVQQQQQNQLNSTYYGGLLSTPPVSTYIPAGTVVGQPINLATPPSHADAHGQAFVKYKYGINPADYIRKDSIPCYACTLPA
uniref:Uncharacterized protein n=1 Tax=viral metagenome TaxID=1070528 RepID=A0A6C0KLV6_9ZZZZ